MTTLAEFVRGRYDDGGFTTEDVVSTFLPLVAQVVALHERGLVAPLEGLEHVQVVGIQLEIDEQEAKQPRSKTRQIRRLQKPTRSAVEVVGEHREKTDVDQGESDWSDKSVAADDAAVTGPVYLVGYRCWEHELEHHDPLTDSYVLGLILASLALGLDFEEREHVERFVAHRSDLFSLRRDLHPVLVRAILRLTDLDRRNRPQDLEALLSNLGNYRDQQVDIDIDLSRIEGFKSKDLHTREQVVLSTLQKRLFEISRRNKLLHFTPTAQALNLTQASVPLSFDPRSIRSNQVLTWRDDVHELVAGGKKISLNKYLNFQEATYLAPVLTRIRADARRDRNEFGFEQLRLVACFLRWSNLKESPVQSFESPLVLIPVELTKQKGVKDRFHLQPLSEEAEVNPIIRHLFRDLYDVELPETLDLTQTDLMELHRTLTEQLRASEPALDVRVVDKPRIELIHAKARRRLEQYRRRARLTITASGSLPGFQYSYKQDKYQPLGLQLFNSRVRPPSTHLRELVERAPRARQYAAEPVAEASIERSFYAVKTADDDPYTWEFDLCNMTLANLRYRRMTLVRDYEDLLTQPRSNPAFDSVFSLVPRPTGDSAQPPPLDDINHIVACDPTQARAVGRARQGTSYIIQGPPGTGKSQTITNLIADAVALGKRVLFVCEKRAAIDVVHARLKQHGLDPLCTLIHDAKADKKRFVMELKETYEELLANPPATERHSEHRSALSGDLAEQLERLQKYRGAMTGSSDSERASVLSLLNEAVQLSDVELPELDPSEVELLPTYSAWHASRKTLESLRPLLERLGEGTRLPDHAFRHLDPALRSSERPIDRVDRATESARSALEAVLEQLSEAPEGPAMKLETASRIVFLARQIEPLSSHGLQELLTPNSALHLAWLDARSDLQDARTAKAKAAERAEGWRQPLDRHDLELALQQAAATSGPFAFLKPTWWRLRSLMRERYNFASRVVRPTWLQALQDLQASYEAEDEVERLANRIHERYHLSAEELEERLELFTGAARSGDAELRDWVLAQTPGTIAEVTARGQDLVLLDEALGEVLCEMPSEQLVGISTALETMQRDLAAVPAYLECLAAVQKLDDSVARTLRSLALDLDQLEVACLDRAVELRLASHPEAERLTHGEHRQIFHDLRRLWDNLLETNACCLVDHHHRSFWERCHRLEQPASELTAEEKEIKKLYSRGRRQLEHEFGKTMRYRSIRDLVSDETGMVVSDLKPIWLMSPLSVSDTLPLTEQEGDEQFDMVIFDEASQVTLEEAVPSLFRGAQVIVVGDEKQLPPTNFFSSRMPELEDDADGLGDDFELDSNSLLNHAARNMPATMLSWHYRSRSEWLISYSNGAFYGGRLLTVPDRSPPPADQPEIVAGSARDAAVGSAAILERPLSFHFLEHGVYENRRNAQEAEYLAHLVRELWRQKSDFSIGIIAFSEAQQNEIRGAFEALARDDSEFAARLEAEMEREDDGQFNGLLIKNLENIQGDERDLVLLSVCYAHDRSGRMRMNFGPINKSGGEKRLNVAFSRARLRMAVVSSIRHHHITNDYNEGSACFKSYLRFADHCSAGRLSQARQVLREIGLREDDVQEGAGSPSAVALDLAERLRQYGYEVEMGVGESGFRCDIALRRNGDKDFFAAVLVDGESFYQLEEPLERELQRPALLEAFGWRVLRVLTKDWWRDPEKVLQRVLVDLERKAEPPPPDPAPEPSDEPQASTGWTSPDAELAARPSSSRLAATDTGTNKNADTQPDESSPKTSSVDGPKSDKKPKSEQGNKAPNRAEEPRPDAVACEEQPLRRLEYHDEKSSKFWAITVMGASHTVHFGRIGTSGQTRSKSFESAEAALADAERTIASKLRKGYSDEVPS